MNNNPVIDLAGRTFGSWFVINRAQNNAFGSARWNVRCSCGYEKTIDAASLSKGKSKSCGHSIGGFGPPDRSDTAGHSKTRLYRCWRGMVSRCTDGRDKYYGEKGIQVCAEWQSFQNFRHWALNNGYSNNRTIDRIDGNIGYSPANCRWADAKQQSRNRDGWVLTLPDGRFLIDVAAENGVPVGAMYARVARGWDRELAATRPLLSNGRRGGKVAATQANRA